MGVMDILMIAHRVNMLHVISIINLNRMPLTYDLVP